MAFTPLQGLKVVWSDAASDHALLELNDEIPEQWNPYRLGWDASPMEAVNSSVCLHYPKGDLLKISASK